MRFSEDPELEALIGKVCLAFARVEQEAGHVVMSAHGDWDLAMSTDYLAYSSSSGLLLAWVKGVGKAYPEVKEDASKLCAGLRALKARRDQWAHSAAVVDLFLMMKERGGTSVSDSDVPSAKLLNGKKLGHVDRPSSSDLSDFLAHASDVGDAAAALAVKVAVLAEEGVRPVSPPRRTTRASAG